MSEKQFKLSSETVLQYQIMNNDTDLNENEVVDLLNDLNDENEQLRKELVDVTKSIDSLCNRVDKSNRSNEFKWGAIIGLRTLQRELKGDGV